MTREQQQRRSQQLSVFGPLAERVGEHHRVEIVDRGVQVAVETRSAVNGTLCRVYGRRVDGERLCAGCGEVLDLRPGIAATTGHGVGRPRISDVSMRARPVNRCPFPASPRRRCWRKR